MKKVRRGALLKEQLLQPQGTDLAAASGNIRSHYAKCVSSLIDLGDATLRERQAFIDRATFELGEHVDRIQDPGKERGLFQLDLFPRIIPRDEWKFLEQGILQRANAFSRYIADIYGAQRILHAGVLAPEMIFEDPAHFPELSTLRSAGAAPMQLGALDLVKTTGGEWRVLENRFSTPAGMAYVVQIRRIIGQALPEALAPLPVHAVASFAARLAESLAEPSHKRRQPDELIVLLSSGEKGRHFFEECFLARQMGLQLVRAHDLIVRDGRLHLKTIEGLKAVDVIYRRMENPLLDPVAFASFGEEGIPGLVNCVRNGNVCIVNGLGCGIADNRALLPYSNDIIRFYLAENALLPAVQTWHGFDPDQIDFISDNLQQLDLKTISHPDNFISSFPEARQLFEKGRLDAIFRKDPRLIVGQQIPPLATLPFFDGERFVHQEVALRVFFVLGNNPYVIPGGLTRHFHRRDESLRVGKRDQVFKDTWVLGSPLQKSQRKGRLEPELTHHNPPLASSAAESFYWMGRYFERARSTTRKRKVLEDLRWDELSPRERDLHRPLLAAISRLAELPLEPKKRAARSNQRIRESLIFGHQSPSSVQACIHALLANAKRIRSQLTPEFYDAIQRTDRLLKRLAPHESHGTFARTELESIINQADLIYGVGERTLLHDSGWRFFQMGISIERAQGNVSLLKEMLPHVVRRQWQHLRDDSDLTALLRIAGALDAYHRAFRSRAYLDRVVHLLWKSPDCTASIRFCVYLMDTALGRILQHAGLNRGLCLAGMIADFRQWLEQVDLLVLFPARHRELDHGLTRANFAPEQSEAAANDCLQHIEAFFTSFHQAVDDTFFTHHPLAPEPQN